MSDKPKRSFWQIHLSTAVLVMLVVGLLMYLNAPRWSPHGGTKFTEYGWPFSFVYADNPKEEPREHRYHNEATYDDYRNGSIFLDIWFAVSIITVSIYASEWMIRRRENREI